MFSNQLLQRLKLTLLVLVMLNNLSQQTCGKGCISCSSEDNISARTCRICDIFKSYRHDEFHSCSQVAIANCEIPSLDHRETLCMLCKPNYVLDFVQGKCVSINYSKVVADCERYSETSACESCLKDHYISSGKCIKSQLLVANCDYYSSEGICSQCQPDMFVNPEKNVCSSFMGAENCSHYNLVRCNKCKEGFTQDLNFYLRKLVDSSYIQQMLLERNNTSQMLVAVDETCTKLNVENCETYLTADQCIICKQGYYLDKDRQCKIQPVNQIQNCLVYSDKNNCKQCHFLYYLKENKCQRGIKKENCVTYQINGVECIQCSDSYFLNDNKICQKRIQDINQCTKIQLEKEGCEVCEDGYLRDDQNICMSKLPNCTNYNLDGNSDKYHFCTACEPGYFLLDNIPSPNCIMFEFIAHCEQRIDHQNKCQTCVPGYFIQSKLKCLPYTAESCLTFINNEDKCDQCIQGFNMDALDSKCKPSKIAENCQIQGGTPGSCSRCYSNFHWHSNEGCIENNLVGCIVATINKNECDLCDEINQFYLDSSTQKCRLRNIANCMTLKETSFGCQNCDTGYMVNSLGTCSKQVINLDNCKSKPGSNDGMKCLKCDDYQTHYLESNTNLCLVRTNTADCTSFDKLYDKCLTCTQTTHYLLEGKCIQVSVSNCSSLTPLKNECTTCNIDYYLDGLTKHCLPNTAIGCENRSINLFGCVSCKNGYLQNPITKICEEISIPNCKTYSTTKPECAECEDGTFLGLDKRCFQTQRLGCKTMKSSSSYDCATCLEGFFLSGSDCKLPELLKCKEYVNTPGPENKCKVCEDGFYSTGEFKCEKQSLDFCLEYVSSKNECTTCESLYYKNNQNGCSKITKEFCVSSDGKVDKCVICQPNSSNVSGACTPITSGQNVLPVENCLGVTESTPTNCGVCKSGFVLMTSTSQTLKRPAGCALTSTTNKYLCLQCFEGWEMADTQNGLCTPLSDSYSGECIMTDLMSSMTSVQAGLGTSAGKCLKCRNNDSFYASATGCKSRETIHGCSEYSASEDKCVKCGDWLVSKSSLSSISACMPFGSNIMIPNCLTYNLDQVITKIVTTCKVCRSGYSGAQCATFTSYQDLYFSDSFFLNMMNQTIPSSITGAGPFRRGTGLDGNFAQVPTTCSETFNKVYNLEISNTAKHYYTTWNPFTESHNFLGNFMVLNSCDPSSNWTNYVSSSGSGSIPVKEGNCAVSFKLNSTKFYCIACKFGKIGISNSKTVAGSGQVNFVDTCDLAVNYYLQKKYTGMGYKPTEWRDPALSTFKLYGHVAELIPYDSCSNGGIPVSVLTSGTVPVASLVPSLNNATFLGIPIMNCHSNIHASNMIDNCQVYNVNNTTGVPDLNTANLSGVTCMACKPGYAGTAFGTGGFKSAPTACTLIANCDLDSEENTMMNTCGKCEEGYAWDYQRPNAQVLHHKCVKSSSNCLVHDSTTAFDKCIICNKGYTFAPDNTCVKIRDRNCKELGVPNVNITFTEGDPSVTASGKLELAYLIEKVSGGKDTSTCNECENGFVNVTSDSPTDICSGNNPMSNSNPNCKNINPSDSSNCVECKSDYALHSSSKMCISQDSAKSLKHCAVIFNGYNNLTCESCEANHTIGYSKSFVDRKCEHNSECLAVYTSGDYVGKCRICRDGFYISRSTNLCTAIPQATECNRFKLDYSTNVLTCIGCKHQGKVPLNISVDDDIFKMKCISNFRNDPLFTYSYSIITKSPTSGNSYSQFVNYKLFEEITELGSVSPGEFTGPSKACVPEFRQELNCSEYIQNGWGCSSCHKGYIKNSRGFCERGMIPNCISYLSKNECSMCAENFFVAKVTDTSQTDILSTCSARTIKCLEYDPLANRCKRCLPHQFNNITKEMACTVYTVNRCRVYHPTKDLCLICDSGSYMDPSTQLCVPIAIANCEIYSSLESQCLSCNKGFYYHPTKRCSPHSNLNCKVFSEISDKCISCFGGSFLTKDLTCEVVTIKGCLTHHPNRNECLVCQQGFFLADNKVCTPHSALHCVSYNNFQDTCFFCDSSAYKDGQKCKQYRTAINCSSYHPLEDKCITCVPGFYEDKGVCTQYSMLTCQTYHPNMNSCTSCQNGFYLTSGNCLPVTVQNCKTLSKIENKCKSCYSNFYYQLFTGNCLPYTVSSCATNNLYADKCTTCKPGYYLQNDSCHPYSVHECSSYHSRSDDCLSCREGFYLNATKGTCLRYSCSNCSSFHLLENACRSCQAGFYLHKNKCKLFTAKNCIIRSSTENKCLSCSPDSFYNNGICQHYSDLNCKVYNTEQDVCQSCLEGFFFEFGVCLPYTVQNCLDYQPNKDFCLRCDFSSGKIYLDNESKLCKANVEISLCAKYSNSADICEHCISNYYINDQKCVADPSGIPNCKMYLSETTCRQCQDGFFLENNYCKTPETTIWGCKEYSSGGVCQVCKSEYSINSTYQCEPVVETSCATNLNSLNCATCRVNQILTIQNNNFVCVPSNILHCENAISSVQGPLCKKCQSGYFLYNNQCTWPNKTVSSCVEYLDNGICSKCKDLYLLSGDNLHCTPEITKAGENCLSGYVSDLPVCSRCAPGYYFDETGICQSCSDTNDGCSVCNILNLSVCLVCKEGYYMDSDLICTLYPVVVFTGVNLVQVLYSLIFSVLMLVKI